MNSYDDEPNYRGRPRASRHGRESDYPGGRDAYDSGASYGSYADSSYGDSSYGDGSYGDPEPTTGSRSASGRASVGRASVGRSSPYDPPVVAYDEPTSAGRAKVGRASVPGAAPVAGPTYGEPYGAPEPVYGAPYGAEAASYDSYGSGRDPYTASHGEPPISPSGPPGAGRGVGRASVRPVSPSGPAAAGGGGGGRGPGGRPPVPGAPFGPGGPSGPGGPGGPGGMGPGGPGGMGPGGMGPGGPGAPGGPGGRRPFGSLGRRLGMGGGDDGGDGKPRSKKAKSARRRNIIVAAIAVFIMISGAGVVGGTFYVDSVQKGDELKFPETTTIFYSDGSVLAKLGKKTRYPVPVDNMNNAVKDSIVASEDGTFWTNEGVDFKGVMRAAWNNFTGGSTQGASTITQQYARLAFDLKGATYNRKLREAVLAWKIDDSLSKDEILESYLNSVPLGRNTYGIEAAAKAYFGKTVHKDAPPEQQITVAEAMALVAMVKQPEPDPDNPDEYPGYDPTRSDKAKANALDRWNYVRTQMVKLNKTEPDRYLTPEADAALAFPESWLPYVPEAGQGEEKPAGLVINHVLDELTHTKGSYFEGKSWQSIEDGGYQIFTTINQAAQAAAVAAADEKVEGSVMYGQPATLQAAIVAVEPGTGRVLAYYGGDDGKGNDYAGFYYDENNDATGVGRYPPGSSFKVYTLAAALKAGISLRSYWQWKEHPQQGRPDTNPIRNASECTSDLIPGTHTAASGACSLLESTTQSLNIPFYDVTLSVSPAKVLEMARDAGIDYMWNDARERQDLREVTDMGKVTPSKFDAVLGIGQYSVTVLDHANGMATFAAGGLRAKAHFVSSVKKNDETLFGETLPKEGQAKILNPQAVNDLTYAMSQVAPGYNASGWQTATKTGTWEYNNNMNQNAHAWNVGFTKKIAAAAWVGNRAEEQAIVDKGGGTIWGSGFPKQIWQRFMTAATNALNFDKGGGLQFNPPTFIGNEMPNLAVPSPTPSAAPPTNPNPTTSTSKSPSPSPSTSKSTSPSPSGSGTATG